MTGAEAKAGVSEASKKLTKLWPTSAYYIYPLKGDFQKMKDISKKYEADAELSSGDSVEYASAKKKVDDGSVTDKLGKPANIHNAGGLVDNIAAVAFQTDVDAGKITNPFAEEMNDTRKAFQDAGAGRQAESRDNPLYSRNQMLQAINSRQKQHPEVTGPSGKELEKIKIEAESFPEKFSWNFMMEQNDFLERYGDALSKFDLAARTGPGSGSAWKFSDVQTDVAKQFGRFADEELEDVYSEKQTGSELEGMAKSDEVIAPEALKLVEDLKKAVESAGEEVDESEKANMESILERLLEAIPALRSAIENAKEILGKMAPPAQEEGIGPEAEEVAAQMG